MSNKNKPQQTNAQRQASLNNRASSTTSDSHKPSHASSPTAIKLNLHDNKAITNVPKCGQRKNSKPSKNNSIGPQKTKTENKAVKPINPKNFYVSNAKQASSTKCKEITNRILYPVPEPNHKEKPYHPALTERMSINNEEDLYIFPPNQKGGGKKSLISLYLNPTASGFHTSRLNDKNQQKQEKVGESKTIYLNNIEALKFKESLKHSKLGNGSIKHGANKTDMDFYTISTTDKTCTIGSDLVLIRDRVQSVFQDYHTKISNMSDTIEKLKIELMQAKSRLAKYEHNL